MILLQHGWSLLSISAVFDENFSFYLHALLKKNFIASKNNGLDMLGGYLYVTHTITNVWQMGHCWSMYHLNSPLCPWEPTRHTRGN